MSTGTDADVAVVGVGTMGAMTLWQLARRGVSCVGFEQFRVGHELGAGAGESRQFRDNYLEAQVRDVMAGAEEHYRALEADSGLSLLRRTGGLTIGPADSELVTTLVSHIRDYEDEPVHLDRADVARRYRPHRLGPDDVAVWNERSGFVRPELAIAAAHTTARRHGARLVEGHAVDEIVPLGGAVRIRCADQWWTVRRVVVTAGGWAWRLLPGIPGVDLGRLLLTWFPTTRDDLFAVDRWPTFTRQFDGIALYGMPSLSPGTVRIGLVGPRDRFTDPDALDRSHVPHDEIALISDLVARSVSDVLPTVIRAGTYFDAYTTDGQPLVGPVDPSGDIVAAAGFCGRGFKMAPVIGRILADLATVGTTPFDIGAWSPDRFDPVPA